MDFLGSAGDSGDAAIYRDRRRSRDETVELAAATSLRVAPDHLLARAWTSGAVPHPLRRTWNARFWPLQFPPSHERSLRARDPRGAGTIPATDARTLRRRPIHRREQGIMKTGVDFIST